MKFSKNLNFAMEEQKNHEKVKKFKKIRQNIKVSF